LQFQFLIGQFDLKFLCRGTKGFHFVDSSGPLLAKDAALGGSHHDIFLYTDAARPANSEKRNDDMDEKNDKIAHLGILTRTANTINCGAN